MRLGSRLYFVKQCINQKICTPIYNRVELEAARVFIGMGCYKYINVY